MSLSTNVGDLATRIGTEVKALRTLINNNQADNSALTTTAKANLVAAINEVHAAVSAASGIDDGTISTSSTWSSDKIDEELTGKADLDGGGKVPASQLPAYVDDVVEAANFAGLPGTGETGKIYVTLDNNKTYRWSGSAYVEISASPGSTDAVPEGSTNLYHTTARARTAAVADAINNGTTDVAPSQNAVFDALANKQQLHANLTAIADLVTAANKLIYWTGSGAAALTDLTAAGRALLDDADAAAQCTTLNVGSTTTNYVTTFEAALV